MSGSTCSKKAAANNTEPKPLSNEEVYSLLNSLRSEVSSLKSARNSDAAKMQSLQLALSSPPALSSYHQQSYISADNLPLLLENCSPQENRVISHFINAILPPDFTLCINVVPACATAKEFFNTIKVRCCPGNCFQKLQVVRDLLNSLVDNGASQHKPNSTIILSLHKTFAIFKKLGIDADKLEGLLAQAACHTPASLDQVAFDQLVMSTILAKGDKKPSSTFVGQVILNTSQRDNKHPQHASPFIYCISEPQERPAPSPCPCSPYFAKPIALVSKVHCPPEHLVDKFGGSCFHCRCTSHWQANCPHTKGVANPNPRLTLPGPFRGPCPSTPDHWFQPLSSPQYQREHVLQVKFVEHDAVDCVLIDTSESIHLSGFTCFLTNLRDVTPFHIFFPDSNSSITISQMTTLKIPVKHGFIIAQDVPFLTKILGTILSISGLCLFFNALLLSLLVCNVLITTTFLNDCWWIDIVSGEETSSPCMCEINLVSLPQSTNLSLREWHEQLGHACDKVVVSLKQHVPTFDIKSWQTFYFPVCAKLKSTHRIAKAHTDIPKEKPLDLLGPFEEDVKGFGTF
ncbi:hypothetical protein O181_067555 [Austropuccinia psidii MF-1]|uniref:GAG-pre-integrase domain-containing protein n=1 Tax=Austropuccinia psidii MF-1 TaxID=1389203 RepID=A0A9Q3EZ76_9BASI|nr:hypothetical protein [Austropuccinia psidii MF-1]